MVALARCAAVAAVLVVACFDAGYGKFLVFSDFHLDPYYGQSRGFGPCNTKTAPAFGRQKCDSPLKLVRETLQAAKAVFPDPDFIVLAGDICRHGMDELTDELGELANILRVIVDEVEKAFPGSQRVHTPAMWSLGNNDVVPDYELPVNMTNNSVLQAVAHAWSGELTPGQKADLAQGGFYAHQVADDLIIVSINTVVYSVNHSPDTASMADPFGQLAWLEATLQTAANQGHKAYLVGHIPPVVDSYAKHQLWHRQYIARYIEILSKFSSVIAAQLYGHLHSDQFRLLTSDEVTAVTGRSHVGPSIAPALLIGSITPVYGANPSFRVVKYEKTTYGLTDWTVYATPSSTTGVVIDPPAFSAVYSFKNQFQEWLPSAGHGMQHPVSTLDLKDLARAFELDPAAFDRFAEVAFANSSTASPVPSACNAACRTAWRCVQSGFTKDAYDACLKSNSRRKTKATKQLVPIIAGSVGGLLVVVLALFMWHRRASIGDNSNAYERMPLQNTDAFDLSDDEDDFV